MGCTGVSSEASCVVLCSGVSGEVRFVTEGGGRSHFEGWDAAFGLL